MEFSLKFVVNDDGIITVNDHKVNISHAPRSLSKDISHAAWYYMKGYEYDIDGRYHSEVYWPTILRYQLACIKQLRFVLEKTSHFAERSAEYHLPDNCYKVALYGDIIECTFDHGHCVHLVTRTANRYNPSQDLCFAVDIELDKFGKRNKAIVKSVWVNRKGDSHYTLDKDAYVKGKI